MFQENFGKTGQNTLLKLGQKIERKLICFVVLIDRFINTLDLIWGGMSLQTQALIYTLTAYFSLSLQTLLSKRPDEGFVPEN